MDKDGKKVSGKIHSVETLGAADGPGLRFVLFLQGCGLRCKYCHNPDTWAKTEGEMKSAEEILQQALRYKRYWGKKGGITVSGGEALLQIDFVTELFTLAKEKGVNTCLDTAGNPFTRALLHILLNIRQDDYAALWQPDGIPYLRVLGFRRNSSALLSSIKKEASVPLITKVADASSILHGIAYKRFLHDVACADLYRTTSSMQIQTELPNEYRQPIVLV